MSEQSHDARAEWLRQARANNTREEAGAKPNGRDPDSPTNPSLDPPPDEPEGGIPPREIVNVVAGELPYVIDDAEAVLIKCDAEIFEHNTRPTYLGREAPPDDQVVVNPRRVPFVYGADHLADQWTRFVDFQKYDARSKKWVSINCPDEVAKAYLQRRGRRHLRRLRAVISTPILRRDGSILDQPGYDAETALFYDPCGVTYPPIPENSTAAEIAAALATLKAPIRNFPFVPDNPNEPDDPHDPDKEKRSASRSVVLSGILTGVIRASLTNSPLHGFSSSDAGAGKSKLGNIVAITVMGRTVHAVAETKKIEEFEKRVASALMRGDQIIGFDNCTTAVGGGLLSQALSEPSIAIRNFGTLRDIIVENAALVLANGVNLVFSGEVIRRCLRCEIDPKCERPETRKFDFEPLALTAKTRPQMVVAALTLLRAYHVAKRPSQKLVPLGSFDDWSDWPRSTLVWLEEPDPCLTQQTIREADPALQKHAALLAAWYDFKADQAASLNRVIEEAKLYNPCPDDPDAARSKNLRETWQLREAKRKALIEAMQNIASERNDINTRRLGNWISERLGKVINNLRFEREGTHGHAVMWKVVSIAPMPE